MSWSFLFLKNIYRYYFRCWFTREYICWSEFCDRYIWDTATAITLLDQNVQDHRSLFSHVQHRQSLFLPHQFGQLGQTFGRKCNCNGFMFGRVVYSFEFSYISPFELITNKWNLFKLSSSAASSFALSSISQMVAG